MATKKQKRLEMQRRRAEFEAEVRADGLKALEEDRARRAARTERMWDEAHKVHTKRNRPHQECPRCNAIKARQATEKIAKAAALKKAGVSDVDNIYLTDEMGAINPVQKETTSG